jgi:hypothetical protein
MAKQFRQDGVSFRYPDNWRLEREEGDDGWTATLQSPGTAFMTITCDGSFPTPEEMAETALGALRSEYPGLEAEARVESLADRMAVGHDMQFFSFDLTNTCWTRSFDSDAGTVLVLCQVNDLELESYEPAMRAVRASLRVEGE